MGFIIAILGTGAGIGFIIMVLCYALDASSQPDTPPSGPRYKANVSPSPAIRTVQPPPPNREDRLAD